MNALGIILKPTAHGWAVYLTDGRELARFRGPGSKRRALHYVTGATKALGTPNITRGVSANWGHALAGRRRETVRLGAWLTFLGAARQHRLRVPQRSVLTLLGLGCALLLLAPTPSSASGLVVRREAPAESLRPSYFRQDGVPPSLTVAAHNRRDVHPRAQGASLPVLLVLALNSAVMLIRVLSSPPSWMKG